MKKLVMLAISLMFLCFEANAQDKVDRPMDWQPGTTILRSADGRYSLDYQADGNLVLYKKNFDKSGTVALWASGKDGKTPQKLSFQADGNLVCYGFNPKVVWAANCYGKGGKYLYLQNDGNLVVYTAQDKPIWSTDTYERNKGCK